jgi:hypothetical protein
MFKKSTGTKPASTGDATKPVPAAAPAAAPAASKPAVSSAKVSEVKPRTITHDDIARAAYFRWKNHGGDALQNWIAAERELRSGSAT